MSLLSIPGVDLDLLEEQRLDLALLLTCHSEILATEDLQVLDGLLNMLDSWSDNNHGKGK